MNPLARLDLSRFRIDSESFVGQAIELGMRFQKLPPQTPTALLGFLRAKGMYYGQRNRMGIAIAREHLEHGVKQALICLDMGLKDQAGGDLNRAVELIFGGNFEGFYKRGYELAFYQLLNMQKESVFLLSQPEAEVLQSEYRNLKGWSLIVPETWMRPPDDFVDTPQLVDPRKDYALFLQTRARIHFLRSIPDNALQALQQAVGEGRSFDGLLRNLILALSMDIESLLPSWNHIDAFGKTCFSDGKMRPEILDKVLHLMERQLSSSVEDAVFREEILQMVQEEIAFFEQVVHEDLTGFFLLPGNKPVTNDDLLNDQPIV